MTFRPHPLPGEPVPGAPRARPEGALRPTDHPRAPRRARRPGALAAPAAALLLAVALAAAGPRPAGAGPAADGPGAVLAVPGTAAAYVPGGAAPGDTLPPAAEYLWVVRGTLAETDGVAKLVARARAMRVRGLLVQVVGRGDAWYRSDLLPPPEALNGADRDPLGELLPLAHEAGLEVHAWVNACLVWSADQPPRDPRHVLRAHPEWVARLRDGRAMTRLSRRERERLRVEGVFLAPAHPGVRTWIAGVVREIASRYPVDGIHLDYIRHPGVDVGYDPTSRARFALAAGADPLAFGGLPAPERARMDSAWAAFQRDQVTAMVREVRDSLHAVRPGLPLSAAVLADTLAAAREKRQAWGAWLREGLLDRAFPMCYAPPVQTVLDQLAAMSGQLGTERLVPGIAVYNTPPATAAAKIKGARALGFPAIALYSYDSLWERSDRWDRLLEFVHGPRSPLEASP